MQNHKNPQKARYFYTREEVMEKDVTDLKVDVGILQTQVSNIEGYYQKLDKLIERVVDNQESLTNQIYEDMDRRKQDTNDNIKELHSRITTIDRSLGDKIELTERRIMDEMKQLRKDITEHNTKEDREIKKILEWKWMAAGGIIVVGWLISHVKFGILEKLIN